MRYRFFWDEPYTSTISFFYQFAVTLTVLTVAVTLVILARRRIHQARAGASIVPTDSKFDGAGFASEILASSGAAGWSVVEVEGPLANFADPGRRELRLSSAVARGRSIEALAIAAQEGGLILKNSRSRWLPQARVVLILGLRLASGVAWLIFLAGALMLSPFLTDRGVMLYAVVLLTLLAVQYFEAEANRWASIAIREAGLDETWTDAEQVAFQSALQSTRWNEIAATLPIPQRARIRPAAQAESQGFRGMGRATPL